MEPGDPLAPTFPRRRRWGWAAAALAVVAVLVALFLLLDPFADELSSEEFLSRGDEICTEAHDAFKDLQGEAPTTAAEAAELTGKLIDISEDEVDEIRDLDRPSDLDDEVDSYLAAREDGIELLGDGREAAEDQDAGAYASAQAQVAADQLKRLKLAQAVGFTECSRPLVDREELAREAQPPETPSSSAPPTVANPPGFPSSGGG
jgi:hypothetical protein